MYTFEKLQYLVKERMEGQNIIEEPVSLFEPIRYILEDGGKRLRPVLVLMATNIFKEDIESAILPAIGVEIFHNYTLLHDDVMDDADIRRGRPTVHKKWNQNVAILSGDAAAITAYMYLVKCKDKHLRESVDVFNKVAMDVCKGQQYDMEFEKRTDVTCEEYTNMIYLKTAALIAGSLKLGAILGDATKEESQLFYNFGKYLGIAFQLQDDYLDVYGDVSVFGKNIGGDIVSNKKTFLLIKAFELAKGEVRTSLEEWISKNDFNSQEKIERIRGIYNELEVDKITQGEIMKYINLSLDILQKIDVDESKKEGLYEMVNIVKERFF